MKFCWETHEHCTLGLCRFVKIPFQISWKLHSHIGLKEQTQSFPTLCKGGLQKLKKHRKEKYQKKQYSESLGWDPPPSTESGFFVFCCLFFVFFDVFFWVLPLPLADAWGKMVFVLMVVQFLFLWSFFLVRWECSLCSQIGAYLSEKLDSQGLPFCCFFGGPYLIYLYIEEGSTSHIIVYLGGNTFFFPGLPPNRNSREYHVHPRAIPK